MYCNTCSMVYNDNEQKLMEDNMDTEKDEMIRKIIDERIVYNIEDFYDPHSNYDYRSRILYRIQEDLFLAESMGVLDYDDWYKVMSICWSIGSGYDMEERLS